MPYDKDIERMIEIGWQGIQDELDIHDAFDDYMERLRALGSCAVSHQYPSSRMGKAAETLGRSRTR